MSNEIAFALGFCPTAVCALVAFGYAVSQFHEKEDRLKDGNYRPEKLALGVLGGLTLLVWAPWIGLVLVHLFGAGTP